MTPSVSVIIPIYNVEPWLRQCVDSVLGQTLRDIEVILVDDGSPDGCPAICDEYAQKDARVRVIHKPNGGVASAVAAGIRAATGTYVGFVDSDDWVDPIYYEQLYLCVAEQDADLVEGQFVSDLMFPGGQQTLEALRSETRIYQGQEDIRRLSKQYLLSFLYDGTPGRPDRPLTYGRWDKLYRHEVLSQALPLYDEQLSLGEDALLNAALLPDCDRVVTLKATARYHHRILFGTVSHRADAGEAQRIAQAHKALLDIADKKGLDKMAATAFIGSMVHARIYRIAGLADVKTAEKSSEMRRFMKNAPAGALEAFVNMRGSAFLRVFYGLLRHGLAAPCVWMVSLHGMLQKKSGDS